MGATDSKLAFRKGVFRLFEERVRRYTKLLTVFYLFMPFHRTYQRLQMTIGLW
jgi:hypothetical protein